MLKVTNNLTFDQVFFNIPTLDYIKLLVYEKLKTKWKREER